MGECILARTSSAIGGGGSEYVITDAILSVTPGSSNKYVNIEIDESKFTINDKRYFVSVAVKTTDGGISKYLTTVYKRATGVLEVSSTTAASFYVPETGAYNVIFSTSSVSSASVSLSGNTIILYSDNTHVISEIIEASVYI